MNYFVTAIGTDCGKTIVSAILCEALRADYWKPVQAGSPRDLEVVRSLVKNNLSKYFDERYLLTTPASPHAAAKIDGVNIELKEINLPATNNTLIIEGAGGCLVPLNDSEFVIDLAAKFNSEIILVANLYLGSINHTLLTINLLKNRNLKVKGIIFNGEPNPESERVILLYSGYPLLLSIRPEAKVTSETISAYAEVLIKLLA